MKNHFMGCWSIAVMAKMRTLATIAVLLTASSAIAQDVRTLAEAEGKLMFYASFNATDTKLLIDGFKQLYPKIDATFYRATDAQLMERILTEGRAGRESLGRDDELELLWLQFEETRYAAGLRFSRAEILSRRL